MDNMLYTQLFRGPIHVAAYPSWNFQEIFKLQDVTIEPETNEITIGDPTRVGLPEYDGVTSTTALNMTGDAVAFSPAAMAACLYGSVERTPSGTVDAEAVRAYVGRTIRLVNMPLAVTSVTGEGAGGATYTLNVDYAVTPGGIRILAGGPLADAINAAAPDPDDDNLRSLPLTVAYTYPTVDLVRPFITGRKFFRVMCEQVNEAGNNEKRRTTAYYVRISLNGGFPLNPGADFGTVPVSIRMLPDPNIVGQNIENILRFETEVVDE